MKEQDVVISKRMLWPVAEIFNSIQGEGVHTGTPMLFVRLAGCTVGKYASRPEELGQKGPFPMVYDKDVHLMYEQKHSICTAADGQQFLCDTDYRAHEGKLSVNDILKQRQGELHVCITGGEPFMYDLRPFFEKEDIYWHVETSGSIAIADDIADDVWITCCPKEGFKEQNAERVNEWKFLVGPHFNQRWFEDFTEWIRHDVAGYQSRAIFIQPINSVWQVEEDNLARCLALLKKYPWARLSPQLHKYIKVR